MSPSQSKPAWGNPPWRIDFQPTPPPLPSEVDFAVIGGGFTGLAAAASLRQLAPQSSVALFERAAIGGGASGNTGGLVLAETAAGDLPGLGDVLSGYSAILREFGVDGDLQLPGVWELGHSAGIPNSPIAWKDSGELRVAREVPGGAIDPGKVVSGLARASEKLGVRIFEHADIQSIIFHHSLRFEFKGKEIVAKSILLATNAMSLELTGLSHHALPKFTLAVATQPLTNEQIESLGLGSGKPFYTIDLPYLWGRVLRTNEVVFGCGLVHAQDWRELDGLNVAEGEAAELIARLENRVRNLHPVLRDVQFTHRWGGPILISENWGPIVFKRHDEHPRVIVLGAYSGHGVAQSVYLGRWAAEAMLGRRELPDWSGVD
jgi:glycine/D-amino acid oxidase-like deaminating enzyme